ncbi:MAG: pullulanase-associated domain-containing protein [Lachnospirales bacterium]
MWKKIKNFTYKITLFIITLSFFIMEAPTVVEAKTDIIVHYHRTDNTYNGQYALIETSDGETFQVDYIGQDDFGAIFQFSVSLKDYIYITLKKGLQNIDSLGKTYVDLTKGDEVWLFSDVNEALYKVPEGYSSSIVNYFDSSDYAYKFDAKLIVHYSKQDEDYENVSINIWEEKTGDNQFYFTDVDDFGAYTSINIKAAYSNENQIAFTINSDDEAVTNIRYIDLSLGYEIWLVEGDSDIHYYSATDSSGFDGIKTLNIDFAYNRYDNDYSGVTLEYYEIGNEKELKSIPITNNDSIMVSITAKNNIKFDIYKNGIIDDYKNSVIYMDNITSGQTINMRLVQGTNKISGDNFIFSDEGASIESAKIIENNKILVVFDMPILVDSNISSFKVDENYVTSVRALSDTYEYSNVNESYKIAFEVTTSNLNFTHKYKVSKDGINNYVYTTLGDLYSTSNFEDLYTYEGDDLGLNYVNNNFSLRVWAPTALEVEVYIYNVQTSDLNSPDSIQKMALSENGTWVTSIPISSVEGLYYCYNVKFNDYSNVAIDPYAKYVSTSGNMAVFPEISRLESAIKVNEYTNINANDAIIYELHTGNFTADESSKAYYKGKYSGIVEKNNISLSGESVGYDHIKELGVTHVALLPINDFEGSYDVEKEENNFGYGTLNFNVPEGSYATNDFSYLSRSDEFKVMVNELHNEGLGVILDVSYSYVKNHLNSSFQKIVPNYYFRNAEGNFSDGSGYGNEFATERSMVKKFIIDSVVYWATEYGVDGFNFESMALIDVDTMEEISEQLSKIDPNIIIMGNSNAKDSSLPILLQTTKNNFSSINTNISRLSDDFNLAVSGPSLEIYDNGYILGSKAKLEDAKFAVVASMPHNQVNISNVNYSNYFWASNTRESINYLSNYTEGTIGDKINALNGSLTDDEKLQIQKLASVFLFTSQGIPMFQSGEEFGLTLENMGTEEISKSKIIDWELKSTNSDLFNYYKGLIALRKETDAFRLVTQEDIANDIIFYETEDSILAYKIIGGEEDKYRNYVVVINPTKDTTKVAIEAGKYDILVNGENASEIPIVTDFKLNKKLEVPPYTAYVFGATETKELVSQTDKEEDRTVLESTLNYSIIAISIYFVLYFLNKFISKKNSFFKKK